MIKGMEVIFFTKHSPNWKYTTQEIYEVQLICTEMLLCHQPLYHDHYQSKIHILWCEDSFE